MKTALGLLTMIFAVLLQRQSYAGSDVQQAAAAPAEHRDTSQRKALPPRAGNRIVPTQPAANLERLRLTRMNNARGGDAASPVPRTLSMQNERLSHDLPVRPSIVLPATVPALANTRHRGPNPAVVGGPATSNAARGLDASRMNRKP